MWRGLHWRQISPQPFQPFSVCAMQVASVRVPAGWRWGRWGSVVMQRGVLNLSRWTIGGGSVVSRLKEPTWEARLLKEFRKGQEVSAHLRLRSKWRGERLGNWGQPTFQAKLIWEPTYSTWVHWLIASVVEDNGCSLQAREPETQSRSPWWN